MYSKLNLLAALLASSHIVTCSASPVNPWTKDDNNVAWGQGWKAPQGYQGGASPHPTGGMFPVWTTGPWRGKPKGEAHPSAYPTAHPSMHHPVLLHDQGGDKSAQHDDKKTGQKSGDAHPSQVSSQHHGHHAHPGQHPSQGHGKPQPHPTQKMPAHSQDRKPGHHSNEPGHPSAYPDHPSAKHVHPSHKPGHPSLKNGTPKNKVSNKDDSPPIYGGGGSSGSGNYQSLVLHAHNVHRANHSAPPLTWSSNLASTAQNIAASCNYAHNTAMDGGGYGQNIAAGVGADKIATIISNMFYNHEEPYFNGQYGKSNPSGFETWGHFSQVVWKKTSQVGCHTQDCSGKGLSGTGGDVPPFFTVCNYKSPGNVAGQYGSEIGKPLGHPTVTGA